MGNPRSKGDENVGRGSGAPAMAPRRARLTPPPATSSPRADDPVVADDMVDSVDSVARRPEAESSFTVERLGAEAAAPPRRRAAPADMLDTDGRAGAISARLEGLGRRALRYLRTRTPEYWLWVGILALGALLRFWGLGDKPLHHDESMHAYYSLTFARDFSSYAYDPLLHGPFQFHAVGALLALILAVEHLVGAGGVAGNPWINDTTVRIVPALFGLGIVALPLGLRRELGRWGAPLAAFLLAVSPAFVYFSRFLREDVYFNFFMFAMVVCAVNFARTRGTGWFVSLAVSAVLAYATFEGFFITLAIFVGFLAILAAWELAHTLAPRLPATLTDRERTFFSRAGLLLVLAILGAALAEVGIHLLANLTAYITLHPDQSAVQVQQLEDRSVAVLTGATIVLALLVMGVLTWQLFRDSRDSRAYAAIGDAAVGDEETPRAPTTFDRIDAVASAPARAIARTRARLDTREQPFLRLLLGIHWVQWFVAFVCAWVVFVALFWIVPPGPGRNLTLFDGFTKGVGSGLWQGLYYWLGQQAVARGAQPPYYYLLVIPLYEQLAVVFGLAGIVYAIARPTRFRLFLIWWFVASLGFYSWAGEKMPWLTIHILLPLMLLAATMLSWVARTCAALVLERVRGARGAQATGMPVMLPEGGDELPVSQRRAAGWRGKAGIAGAVVAVLLLIPMVHSMLVLTHQDAADGPLEMLIYVQTTNDVDRVMNKITIADRVLYGGKHQLRIAVGAGEEWPFYWYLRDYGLDPHPGTYSSFEYPVNDPRAPQQDVLILLPNDARTFMALHPTGYHMKQYKLRSWWDEAYKPQPCVPSNGHLCGAPAPWETGVGLGNYLSYGSAPPPNAHFDPRLAAQRLWSWLWLRQPLGDTNGSYDFTFVVRDGLPIQP